MDMKEDIELLKDALEKLHVYYHGAERTPDWYNIVRWLTELRDIKIKQS